MSLQDLIRSLLTRRPASEAEELQSDPEGGPGGHAVDSGVGRKAGSASATEVRTHLLDELERDALAALRDGITAAATARPEPDDDLRGPVDVPRDLPPADILALQDRATAPLGRSLRPLASALVASVTGGDPDRHPDVASSVAGVREATEQLARAGGARRARRKQLDRVVARDVGTLLREVAAEHHGLILSVSHPGAGEGAAFAWHAGRPEEIDVCLLERVLQRLEVSVSGTELLLLQRRISRWWFRQYSAGGRKASDKFGRWVREVEWALLDRSVPGIGGTVLEAFIRQGLADGLPPLQASLAERLPGSFVSGFVVVERDGSRTVLQNLRGNRRYEIGEHSDEIHYGPGEVALGRLIPGEGSTWLRSPGMAFVGADRDGLGEVVRETLRMSDREDAYRAIAVEAALMALTTDEKPPRKVRPALTRKLAKDLGRRTVELLEEADLAEPVDEDLSAEMEAAGAKRSDFDEIRTIAFNVDEMTADWLSALDAQGRGMA